MANHDRLHQWWWGPDGPQNGGQLTIQSIGEILENARMAGIAIGRGQNAPLISEAGWNYAVLRFLIKYCLLPIGLGDALKIYAHPRTGNYRNWRNHNDTIVSVSNEGHI